MDKNILINLRRRVKPEHAAPEGVRGWCYPVLLRGHWATSEQGALGVLLDFEQPFKHYELDLLGLDMLHPSYNHGTIEQWEFQIAVLREQVERQSLQRDAEGNLLSPFPASLIFDSPQPFHYRDPGTALARLRDMHTSFHNGPSRRQQVGGDAPNVEIKNPIAEKMRAKFGEMQLLLEDADGSFWRVKSGLVGLVESEHCNAESAMRAAATLSGLRSGHEQATVCVICDDAAAWKETERVIERMKALDVTLITTRNDLFGL